MSDWFEDWFNTKEYLEVYRHRNESEAKELVSIILNSIQIPENGSVLDLACGAGRHSIYFAQKGYDVTAVDLSQNLLLVAKEAALDNKVNIEFIQSDIRYFSSGKKFDLIVNLFTSFGYFETDSENFMLFEIVKKYLNNSGYFVLDYLNKTYVQNNLVKESTDMLGKGKIIQKRFIEGNRVVKDIFINQNGSSKHYRESVRLYDDQELKAAISDAGLRIEKVFGEFNGKGFEKDNSKRIIIIASK